jgi:hypothetical protein
MREYCSDLGQVFGVSYRPSSPGTSAITIVSELGRAMQWMNAEPYEKPHACAQSGRSESVDAGDMRLRRDGTAGHYAGICLGRHLIRLEVSLEMVGMAPGRLWCVVSVWAGWLVDGKLQVEVKEMPIDLESSRDLGGSMAGPG